MEITFFGAARTVTGSQHLIDVNGYRILLDCGLYQGPRQESKDRNRHLPFDAASVDVLILSHAHIDHSGNIPNLVKSGFTGDIISTFATRDLCNIMLRDSAKIQEMDVEYLNKKRRRSDLPPLEPIYTMADALDSLKLFIGIGYERPFCIIIAVTEPGTAPINCDKSFIVDSFLCLLIKRRGCDSAPVAASHPHPIFILESSILPLYPCNTSAIAAHK